MDLDMEKNMKGIGQMMQREKSMQTKREIAAVSQAHSFACMMSYVIEFLLVLPLSRCFYNPWHRPMKYASTCRL